MGRVVLYVGWDVLGALPDSQQEEFEMVNRYKPDSIQESLDSADGEFSDEVFVDLQDYEDFWGDDFSEVMGDVYKKVCDDFTDEDRQFYEGLASEEDGNQLRVKAAD